MSKNKDYNHHYFQKHRKKNLIHRLFIHWVDRKEPVLRFLKNKFPKKTKLLDVGCGSGLFLNHAQNHFDCTGIDTSTDGLTIAKNNIKKSHLINRSAYDLHKFKPNSFTVVTCFDILEHLEDLDKVLDGIWHVLRSDGILVISAPNAGALSNYVKWKDRFTFIDPTHVWHFTSQEWSFILRSNGFIPMKLWHGGLIDTPYFPYIPKFIQDLTLKYPSQILSLLGLPIPSIFGETFFMVLIKSPGIATQKKRPNLFSNLSNSTKSIK